MILSQKILKQLIVEVMSRMEAECAANISIGTEKPFAFPREEIIAAFLSGPQTWKGLVKKYRTHAEEFNVPESSAIADELEDCLNHFKQKVGGTDWEARRMAGDFRAPRPPRRPRMRPGGAGDAADETLVGFVTEQMIMEELSKEEACCIAYWSPGYSSIIKSKIAQFTGDPDGGKARKAALVCELSDAIAANYKTNNKDWKDYRAAWEKKYQNPDNPDATKVKNLTYEKIVKCVEGMMHNAELDACNSCDPADYEKYEKEEDEWNAPGGDVTMELEELRLRKMVMEELTKTDKAEIKKMISDEMEKSLKPELKKILQDELIKELGSKKTKEEVGEIAKKVIKKLYKDLSYHHPYIIDRIKV